MSRAPDRLADSVRYVVREFATGGSWSFRSRQRAAEFVRRQWPGRNWPDYYSITAVCS